MNGPRLAARADPYVTGGRGRSWPPSRRPRPGGSSVRRVSEPPGQPRVEFEPHARTISQNLALYEQKFGPIRTPGTDALLYPPEEPGDDPPQ